MRSTLQLVVISAATLLWGCVGNKSSTPANATPPPTLNTMAITVDSGPTAATGQVNHAYVTVRVCASGSTTQCANIDHVQLDTGSWGLRLVRSVLTAASVTLTAETDTQGRTIEECVHFGGGQTWGPVALADVTLAGEVAAKVPVQVLDDSGAGAGAAALAACGATALINDVASLGANGLLGVGVFAQDCGTACTNAATPLPTYFGCPAAGVCIAENVALTAQVTNPVAMFAADNNGIIVNMPNLINANGDVSVQGELIFGIATQTDNALPVSGLTVLAADAAGDFRATYNGATTLLPALIDSGTDAYSFNATINPCVTGSFIGYYCPAVAPLDVYAVNSPPPGVSGLSNTVHFAIADPNTFVANASAFMSLANGGGSTRFSWGMPFFYGRKIYIGINQQVAGTYTGPFYAY